MFEQDTYSSLLGTYQQAKARGENVKLTLETKDCVETVELTVSRPAGGPAAWREEREKAGWRTPAKLPAAWRTPARPGDWRRSPGTGASGGAWAPPTPKSTGLRKSPSQLKRDSERSELRRTVWKQDKLKFDSTEEKFEKMTAKNIVLEEPKTVEKPMITENLKHLQEESTEDITKLESESKLVSKSEEKKPYPKMSLEWTNVMCDKLTDGTTRPYHILVKPNKIRCGGISVIGNSQTFAGLHRLECWKEEDPCCDWPDRHDKCNLIEYNKKRQDA